MKRGYKEITFVTATT